MENEKKGYWFFFKNQWKTVRFWFIYVISFFITFFVIGKSQLINNVEKTLFSLIACPLIMPVVFLQDYTYKKEYKELIGKDFNFWQKYNLATYCDRWYVIPITMGFTTLMFLQIVPFFIWIFVMLLTISEPLFTALKSFEHIKNEKT